MMFKFALRNVLKNRKRSFITALAISSAAMIIGFSAGWINGLIDQWVGNTYIYQTGHIRITTQAFFDRERFMPVEELVYGSSGIADEVRNIEGVTDVEERIRFGILLGKNENTTQAFGMGVDLFNNKMNIADKIVEGGLDGNGIIIGSGLMKKLGAQLGDNLLLATKTSEGGLNGIKLPITA
jgi:putative ABC transport system permease protein